MRAATITEVLDRLTTIINDAVTNNRRTGYFAALYYKVTFSVQQGILNNRFDDGPRMERLDVNFANRYLDAYDQWKNKQPMTGSWQVAFDTIDKASPLVLQQLFLGMNAHINLDLGIATVETMKGKNLQEISNDFNNINSVISALTNQVIRELDRIAPLLSLLGLHASRNNSILIQFSIGSARDGAWRFAEELNSCKPEDYDKCISERDKNITQLAMSLVNPGRLVKFTIWVIHLFEWKQPARITKELHEFSRPYLKVGQVE